MHLQQQSTVVVCEKKQPRKILNHLHNMHLPPMGTWLRKPVFGSAIFHFSIFTVVYLAHTKCIVVKGSYH